MGEWKIPGTPHKGWYCIDVYEIYNEREDFTWKCSE